MPDYLILPELMPGQLLARGVSRHMREHDFVSVASSLDVRTDNEGRFRIPSLVPGLKYAFGFEDEPGRFPVLCIKDVKLMPGETRDLGDLKPLPGPHDNDTPEL